MRTPLGGLFKTCEAILYKIVGGASCFLPMENIREHIVNKVAELDTNSHQEIFNFIKRFDANFTQNNNGIFVDLNTMNEEELYELVEKIDQLIDSNEACFVFDNFSAATSPPITTDPFAGTAANPAEPCVQIVSRRAICSASGWLWT